MPTNYGNDCGWVMLIIFLIYSTTLESWLPRMFRARRDTGVAGANNECLETNTFPDGITVDTWKVYLSKGAMSMMRRLEYLPKFVLRWL